MPKRHYPPAKQPIAYTQMVMKRKRRPDAKDSSVVWFSDINPSCSLPTRPLNELEQYRNYKRDLRTCEEGACLCTCNCHAGESCYLVDYDEGNMIHTRNHEPERHVVIDEENHTKEVYVVCHEQVNTNKFHRRKPNTAHKRSHR